MVASRTGHSTGRSERAAHAAGFLAADTLGRPAAGALWSWLVLIAMVVLGCDGSSQPSSAASSSATLDPAAVATAMIEQECSRCHSRSSLQGKTAAEIRAATQNVPSMSKFQNQLTADQLRALQGALAAEPAGE